MMGERVGEWERREEREKIPSFGSLTRKEKTVSPRLWLEVKR